jgi:hypothetical protein
MAAGRGDLLADDAQQAVVGTGLGLMGGVVVVGDGDEIQPRFAGAGGDLGDGQRAVAVYGVHVEAAAVPARPTSQRLARARRQRDLARRHGAGGFGLDRHRHVDSGVGDLVQAESDVPLPGRQPAGPVSRRGGLAGDGHRRALPPAPAAKSGRAEIERARLEQSEIDHVAAGGLVVGVAEREARRPRRNVEGDVLVAAGGAVLRRVADVDDSGSGQNRNGRDHAGGGGCD